MGVPNLKREIFCPKCAQAARTQFPTEQPYPGEHVKFVPGFAKSPFRCDHCGYTALVIGKAVEPFFCRQCPNRLISIEPQAEAVQGVAERLENPLFTP